MDTYFICHDCGEEFTGDIYDTKVCENCTSWNIEYDS